MATGGPSRPFGLAFLPDGGILVTERADDEDDVYIRVGPRSWRRTSLSAREGQTSDEG